MARRIDLKGRRSPRRRRSFGGGVLAVVRAIPWKLLVLVPVLVAIAIPSYIFASHVGSSVFPSLQKSLVGAINAEPTPMPTPPPSFPAVLPQVGSIHYAVQEGDSCDSALTDTMHMNDAGEVFSDTNASTVSALDHFIGQDCHKLQPGLLLTLSPQYPLIAFGGVVEKIDVTSAGSTPQAVPTPLIHVPPTQYSVDCTGGCWLTVQVQSNVTMHVYVETSLTIRPGSWLWAQAALARQNVKGFVNFPYADPHASLNGMSVRACDLQINAIHDNNGVACSDLMPNSISTDGGAWLFGVTGQDGLSHWKYPLHLPNNTRVLLWLTQGNTGLQFEPGSPVYKYDAAKQLYVNP